MFIERDFTLSASEDYRNNIAPNLHKTVFANPVMEDGLLIGWRIISIYSVSKSIV